LIDYSPINQLRFGTEDSARSRCSVLTTLEKLGNLKYTQGIFVYETLCFRNAIWSTQQADM